MWANYSMTSSVTDDPESASDDEPTTVADDPSTTAAESERSDSPVKSESTKSESTNSAGGKPESTKSGSGRSGSRTGSPRRMLGYRRQRFEARKVRRLVRHIDPWSVLKLAVLLSLCLWIILVVASVIIWSVANNTGALDSLEDFINQTLDLEDWTLDGEILFRQFALLSLLGCLGFAAMSVVFCLVFNLISDIIGGVWISVIEEETARPVLEPLSPRE